LRKDLTVYVPRDIFTVYRIQQSIQLWRYEMARKITRQAVIEEIVKGGSNRKTAENWTAAFYDLAVRRGCETVKQFADAVTGFACC
jgi:hypothetical protein